MFQKVLIANRGEIAVRIASALRALGIASVAIHSEADTDSPHVRAADEAHACGPASARESYLAGDRILEIARRVGADAIHPGYGFLSENADFADACRAAGVVFIGPEGRVLRELGDKVAAREAADRAGVAVIPGSRRALDDDQVAAEAGALGFPVMVKACAGGGGRGLRRVEDAAALARALPRARSEAGASFGDERVYVEKWLERPRHVEVQILADTHGRVVDLFERDCSTQRRHQKLIEEAPAPNLAAEQARRMREAAVALAREVGFAGAGTCEFLLDAAGDFHFLEMNPRVQVEHPVTEAVTGVDIVAAMIRIAAGEPLDLGDAPPRVRGHAVEARIYAENPEKRFMPSPGVLDVYREPSGEGIRIDSGVVEGSRVTVHYDPLLAKVIAWGEDRLQAIDRLDAALADFAIEGIATTIPFHRRVLADERFREGPLDTAWVEREAKAAR